MQTSFLLDVAMPGLARKDSTNTVSAGMLKHAPEGLYYRQANYMNAQITPQCI